MKIVKVALVPLVAVTIISGFSGAVYAKNEGNVSHQQKVVTENDVKNKYYPMFKQLEGEAKSSINKLVSDALSGKGNPSEIIAKGIQLRDEITLKFNQLLEQMKKELEDSGLKTDLVSEAKAEFSNQSLIQKDKVRNKINK
ncbi:hypothetical protein [Ammoniphilus sp. 3BR4]|uniref:hypothetical protein n=1 Tax=Ammoniphilus sp. 3BR4 TaxID=3158265 RepID=UPI003464EB07